MPLHRRCIRAERMTAIPSRARDGQRGGRGRSAQGVWDTRVGAALRKGRRDVRFVRHRLPDHRGVRCFSPRSRFTFEKICALARELIGGNNNEISDSIN